jgi:hypothetical protein
MLGLCGRTGCPILIRLRIETAGRQRLIGDVVQGASPPSTFIGERGYPYVYAGPMVPASTNTDTSTYDDPAAWLGKTMNEILEYRIALVRSLERVDARSAIRPGRNIEAMQELAMSSVPVDTELRLTKPPVQRLSFSQWTPPMGPTALLREVRIVENPAIPRKIDQLVGDADCPSTEAIVELSDSGISTYHITRLLSSGLLGRKSLRKFVPTRWSITAVDDILGRDLHEKILDKPWINEYRVFTDSALGNNIAILLLPTSWMFEVLECWTPGTIFLSPGYQSEIPSDHEFAEGRRTYAKTIGGAYYAARFPVLRYLERERRQAGAIVFLEVTPEWSAPLGVWRVREICGRALSRPPDRFNRFRDAVERCSRVLTTPIEGWMASSKIAAYHRTQRTLLSFE